ncbi:MULTISPECIES: TrlF family AAA-like ATPase [unclassified Mesorhizobium]|uniref:TrlF family AAA-like ATPase n=1 Tax=unclassified Mesorhizobium TaxID=325217 RepID=UPI00112956E0|nr:MULTISPECIES: ABC transporter [unclassified Mesorhizobium]MBZ9810948.1 ABC transporter [Mesorhizobium sp. ESP-6-2]TPM27737.1 ABC transporter [Mesorhizobium sp. B2-2-2]
MYSRGSEWREWDLHIHSPASFHWNGERFGSDAGRNKHLVDEMIRVLNEATPIAFGLMDYWSFDGWFALKTRQAEHGAPALEKTVFPGIELRLSAPMQGRLNAHVLFSNEISDQHLKDFLSGLKLELISQPLSPDALIDYARFAGADKLASHGFDKSKVASDETEALRAGSEIAEVNVDSYKEAIRNVPGGRAIGFMPFSTNDGLDSVKWYDHYAYALGLFQSSPIFETRKSDLWAAFCGVETETNKKWFGNFQAALRGIPRLAVSGSDAHCFRGNGTNDKRGYGDFPSGKRTWIKADPTWKGLLQALKEPAKRSYLGERPPKLERISQHKTFYIDRVRISRATGSTLSDTWLHGTEIPLNPDLIAVIGNKGSGKSALADIVALLGNSQQSAHFSFLKRDRFRGKAGEPARQFVGELSWLAGDPCVMSLSEDPSPGRVELVRYIPQGRFEALCNDHVSGKTDEFERELREVIFSHAPTDVRLDALSFDQLIEKQEIVFRARVNELRKSLRALNEQIVETEDQLHPTVRKNLDEQIRLKRKQIEEHLAIKPPPVAQPTEELTADQKQANVRLAEIATALETLAAEGKKAGEERQAVGRKQRSLRSISERTGLFEKQFATFISEIAEDLALVDLKADELVALNVNHPLVAERQQALVAKDREIAKKIESAATTQSELIAEHTLLAEKLNEPQQKYQASVKALKDWQAALEAIEGSETEPESLKGLQRRLEQIEELPSLLAQRQASRQEITGQIFAVLGEQRAAREALFAPLQRLIQSNALIREEYKLQFQAKLLGSPDGIAANLFSAIKQSKGELRGEDESFAAVRSRFEKYRFDSAADAIGFAEDIAALLAESAETAISGPGIRSLMRKDKEPAEVYSYLFGLPYLEPKYTLLFQDAQIEQLSPGQRGALLLIFYLLVDKGRNPIVLDQPEENLDNETVVSLLVPVLNEAKKSRQIIMVTHNPNLAVVCDAEQIIHATFDRKNGARISYHSGSIEDGTINRAVVDVLEGTKIAFDNRGQKYH